MSAQLKSLDEIRLMRSAGLDAAAILDDICAGAKVGATTWDLEKIARAGIERFAKLVEQDIVAIVKALAAPDLAASQVAELTTTYTGLRQLTKAGLTAVQQDQIIRAELHKHAVRSAFLGYAQPPYPAVLCTSINEVIVHGIPRKDEVLKDGDIIGIDFGIFKHGFCADNARTVLVGDVREDRKQLVDTTREALDAAIGLCRVGNRLGDLGAAVQNYAESRGYSVVRQFVGHGTGRQMHEDPQVPNFGLADTGKRFKSGLVIAVEPMVNAGTPEVETLDDKWTAVTKDRALSAHFEHTIAILDEGPWVLTRPSSTPGHP